MKQIYSLKNLFLICLLFVGTLTSFAQTTYKISDFAAGSQYADDEAHVLDENFTLYTTDCHFTTQLRMYGANASNGNENGFFYSSELSAPIASITFNIGNKADQLKVSGSHDGSTWNEVATIDVTAVYADQVVNFGDTGYKYFKGELVGKNQIRITAITITYASDIETGINNITANNLNIYSSKGGVVVNATEAATINIYSITGQLVKTAAIEAGVNQLNLSAGIYVIANKKVVVL